MDQTTTTTHENEDGHGHAEPHMPAPSLSPIILAAGMVALVFGLVFGPIVLVLGILGVFAGLGTWLYDEMKNASAAEQH